MPLDGKVPRPKPFGTMVIDPPWPYQKAGSKHVNASGYSSGEYNPLTMEELASLPVSRLCDYLFLWSTPVFTSQGLAAWLANRWGFDVITGMYWVKVDSLTPGREPVFKPSYGVGYWFRGCVEPILVCKMPNVPSIRTPWIGLMSEGGRHSRKPDTLYEAVETYFPGPYGEMFARRSRAKWGCMGNEAPGDGSDIRESVRVLLHTRFTTTVKVESPKSLFSKE